MFKRTATRFHARSGIVAPHRRGRGQPVLHHQAHVRPPARRAAAPVRLQQRPGHAVFLAGQRHPGDDRRGARGWAGRTPSRTCTSPNTPSGPGTRRPRFWAFCRRCPPSRTRWWSSRARPTATRDFQARWAAAVAGESDFAPVFCAWWEQPEYRRPARGLVPTREERQLQQRYGLDDQQLSWRRW